MLEWHSKNKTKYQQQKQLLMKCIVNIRRPLHQNLFLHPNEKYM